MVEHSPETMRHCVNAYLKYISHIHNDIREINNQIEEIRQIAIGLAGVDYNRDTVSVSTEGDKIGTALAKIEELRLELADRVSRCYSDYDHAKQLCAPHFVGRYILWLNRIEHKTYVEIASIVNYDDDYVYELARGGMVDLYYAMPEEFRRNSIPNAMPL